MATEEQIKELAYFLWEKEGQPEGKHLEHYSRAKQILEEQEAVHDPATEAAKESALEIELKSADQKVVERRQKDLRQSVEEHLTAIRRVIEEEMKAISTKAESPKKSRSKAL
jgi:hypothetical protein